MWPSRRRGEPVPCAAGGRGGGGSWRGAARCDRRPWRRGEDLLKIAAGSARRGAGGGGRRPGCSAPRRGRWGPSGPGLAAGTAPGGLGAERAPGGLGAEPRGCGARPAEGRLAAELWVIARHLPAGGPCQPSGQGTHLPALPAQGRRWGSGAAGAERDTRLGPHRFHRVPAFGGAGRKVVQAVNAILIPWAVTARDDCRFL